MTSSKIHVLNINVDVASSEPRPPGTLALELQRTMLKLKGQYMSADGREVKYDQLRGSQLFAEYEKVARRLSNCDLEDLQDEAEKKAFFISILRFFPLQTIFQAPSYTCNSQQISTMPLQCMACQWPLLSRLQF